MNIDLKNRIISLADKYESPSFLLKDPSKFMHLYDDKREQELVAFIASSLSFGRREQILFHVQMILDECKKTGSVLSWILNKKYKKFFNGEKSSFYRMFTHQSMIMFFEILYDICSKDLSLGEFFKTKYESGDFTFLHQVICSSFSSECNLIPHTQSSACKRVNMFLRWMVRDNSPVDLGLWKWFDKKNLLMPMDVHVLNQSCELGLLDYTSAGKIPGATLKNCIALTKKMGEIFPNDPVKGDFALFGLGVDN